MVLCRNFYITSSPGYDVFFAQVGRLVHAMKMGWIKPRKPKREEEEDDDQFYQLWKDDDQVRGFGFHLWVHETVIADLWCVYAARLQFLHRYNMQKNCTGTDTDSGTDTKSQ